MFLQIESNICEILNKTLVSTSEEKQRKVWKYCQDVYRNENKYLQVSN